jgi:hypothetical protein
MRVDMPVNIKDRLLRPAANGNSLVGVQQMIATKMGRPIEGGQNTLARLNSADERSTDSAAFAPADASAVGSFALFAGFIATMTRSDFSCPCVIGYGSSPSRCGPSLSRNS